MKRFYKIFRTVVVTLIALVFIVPAALYVALSLPAVQSYICRMAEKELSALLTVDVSIDYVSISPFNRVTLHGVTVADSLGKPALKVQRLGAGMNIWAYIAHERVVVDYAELIGMDARIYRDSIGAPLNIQPIIDALSPKDKSKPPTKFDFRINTVVMRTSSLTYDVLSEDHVATGFDPNHVSVSGLRADIQLPQIKNDDFIVDLKRLAFNEKSGFALSSLSGIFHVSATLLEVTGFDLAMPHSRLRLNDQILTYSGFEDLKSRWQELPFDLHLLSGSHISTVDISPFIPQLGGIEMTFDLHLHAAGNAGHIELQALELSSGNEVVIEGLGSVDSLVSSDGPRFDFHDIKAVFNAPQAMAAALRFTDIGDRNRRIFENLGNVQLTGRINGSKLAGDVQADVSSGVGRITFDGQYVRTQRGERFSPLSVNGMVSVTEFSGMSFANGLESPLAAVEDLNAVAYFDLSLSSGLPDGFVDMEIESVVMNGSRVSDLMARVDKSGDNLDAVVFVDNPMLYVDAEVSAIVAPGHKHLDFNADLRDVSLAMLGIDAEHHPERRMSLLADASLNGTGIDDIAGNLTIDRISVDEPGNDSMMLSGIRLDALRGEYADTLRLSSQIADVAVIGLFHLESLPAVGSAILSQTLPVLAGIDTAIDDSEFWNSEHNQNEFTYKIDLKTLDPLYPLVSLPVRVIDPICVAGSISSSNRSMSLTLDAPYLLQGKKVIEQTSLSAGVSGPTSDGMPSRGHIYFATTLPTKSGPMTLATTSEASNDQIDSHFEWKVARARDYSGDLNFTTRFGRDDDNTLRTEMLVNPGRLVFNDTVWTVDPARITMAGKEISVEDFRVWRDRQFFSISGKASESPADTITLSLEDVNLDYVFEALDIPTAMFGGNATGRFFATQVLTAEPKAYTPRLFVKDLKYNYSLMGDAVLRSEWVNDTKGISIIAEIKQPNGFKSYVDGEIFPMADSLDMYFDADRIEIGFLKPYMSAFASDISGYATGKARLWGTFKLIDMVGDVYGEDVKLTLGFTNTAYTTTDSVHLTPGRIDIRDLTLKDASGNSAKLNGWVTHKCFKLPEFEFKVTEARNLLVYDVKENAEHPWYGRVYGNGGATISGVPGLVDIKVMMSTASESAFTYVLSDALSAQDYNFITFRDRDQARKDSIGSINAPPPPLVQEIKKQLAAAAIAGETSTYRMTFDVEITPQALITLVMDPVGGDRVRAHGNGVMHMFYDSRSEDLEMKGSYTVDRGTYNFTLQDIIIKEFIIEPSSSITFNGDPYAAQLNLIAKHQVKANLTDLDESFSEDKELNRTNVPVDAIMKVSGDMRQPDISFDLDFPTLTEETKRKVRSIISTEDMMQRQIIYLLALSRFYTPDYMNATRGNELVSVASSTISSQLSNILGQLSDNWNIAPNFRSDRGDFSDVEFDLALSSHLLNNRLLLNGNLGYRDKSLNNNSFIGDFDIEYLLNSSGSLRLKAYNRYNDQNYYLKSALTTQGVGIVVKRDFDSFFSFLRPWLRKSKKSDDATAPSDSIAPPAVPTDSVRTLNDL